ncbi:MAG: RimK family alpha-L-glutamate ligase [Clostridia bacterium]|nr:RimK family alpha-L-glutamate ligase [Clostridia bacterium]
MMKKGLILTNAYAKLAAFSHPASRLQEELLALGVAADILRNDGFHAYIDEHGEIQTALCDYDFCVYLDKDKYISQALEKRGLRLFNHHQAIIDCDDKATTFLRLSAHNIPMPTTLFGLLCYTPDCAPKTAALDKIERTLGYPLIAKTCFGSLGKGVYKIDNRNKLTQIATQLQYTPHLFQEFIAASAGKDVRVIVIGGKVQAAMLRRSTTDFRSNIELGGVGEQIEIPQELKTLCEKVASILQLDYCGIDVLLDSENYRVCEVNSNAFFSGIEKVTGVNIAKRYAEHIYGEIYKK